MNTESNPTPAERCARARDLLPTDARAAFAELRPVLAYPAALDDALLRDALGVMRAIAEEIVGDHLAGVIGWARDHLDDPEALYDAAYALYEQKLHDLGATLLARANRLAPGSATIVTELSANLEALLLHPHAARVLRESGLVETDDVCAYLFGYNALLSGDLEAARPIVARLHGHADEPLAYMGAALAGMVARADAIRGAAPLDDRDLAGWHLAINGTVLLHLSPHGYEDVMRGRYAYVSDQYARIREGIERLAHVLSVAEIAPPRVLALPDRSSRVVALAAAQILGVPCEPFAADDTRPGVVVAYDLDQVEDAEALGQLREHRPGQVLFAHASCWTEPFSYAPDVTTFLYQLNAAPWQGDRWDVKSEPDPAPIEELAARIVAATGEHESVSSLEQLAALVRAAQAVTGDAAAGLFRSSGQRLRQRAGSPVWSARFT
jgi:hypothetical protein